MRIILNAANLRGGGGFQLAQQLFSAATCDKGNHMWHFIMSEKLKEELLIAEYGSNIDYTVVKHSPARLVDGINTRRTIAIIEEQFRPDCVYTLYGPAYYRFKAPHLMGFAVPWITQPNKYAWSKVPWYYERLRFIAWCKYVALWARCADMWQLETGIAAEGLAKRLNKDMTLFHVIPNTCGIQYFEAARLWSKEENEYVSGKNGVFILLVFTAWYRHKNLEIIPYVADALRKIAPHMKFLFRLTLPKNEMPWKHIRQIANKLGVGECVENIGPQKPIDGPRLYKCSDALFLPTLLEVFSANYPEAMCMRRPIITTDMEFARDICCNAAKYFKPDDPYDAAMAIIDVAKDERLRKELVKNGEQRLLDFGRPESKLARIVEIMELMVDARRTTKGRIPQ